MYDIYIKLILHLRQSVQEEYGDEDNPFDNPREARLDWHLGQPGGNERLNFDIGKFPYEEELVYKEYLKQYHFNKLNRSLHPSKYTTKNQTVWPHLHEFNPIDYDEIDGLSPFRFSCIIILIMLMYPILTRYVITLYAAYQFYSFFLSAYIYCSY